ncbi:signal peptidase I [Acidobacteriota bacterium]
MVHKSRFRDYFESAIVAVVFALFVRTFVIQAFKIPSGSMEDNLLVGDHILVNKLIYAPPTGIFLDRLLPYRQVRHSEVVVFKFPVEPERDFIKRTIGLPTDLIRIDKQKVFRNDKLLEEPYTFYKPPPPINAAEAHLRDQNRTRVPEGYYFMLGDNRNNSQDSRYWKCVPGTHIKGRALLIYWSFQAREGTHTLQGTDKVKEFFYVVTRFFHKSRWRRTFKLIR